MVASTRKTNGQEQQKNSSVPSSNQIDRKSQNDRNLRPLELTSKAPEKLSTQATEHKGAGVKSELDTLTTVHRNGPERFSSQAEKPQQQVHATAEPSDTEAAIKAEGPEPPASLATLVQEMNPLHPRVAEVEQRIGSFDYEKHKTTEVAGLVTLGPYRYADGSTYTGQFKHGRRHGRGRQTWKNGSVYDGYWEADKFSGKGRIIFFNGNVYTGDLKQGKLEGFGEYAHYDGTTYIGEWKADKQNGKGEEKWSDGSAYKGDYKDDLKEGRGVLLKADGTKYEGKFVQGEFVEGTCSWRDGRKYKGSMQYEQMQGPGKLTWPTGETYTGSFAEHLPHGEGELVFQDGTKYKGQWANGKQHGEGIFTNEKGVERKGLWKDGNRVEWTDGLPDTERDQKQ